MPMNPAVQAVIKAITRLQPDVANSWNSQRKVEDAAGKLTIADPRCRIDKITATADDGYEIPLRVFTPLDIDFSLKRGLHVNEDHRGTILYLHGGGWANGDVEFYSDACMRTALKLERRVIAVDYRRSPEHRFPTALEDCYAVARLACFCDNAFADAQQEQAALCAADGTLYRDGSGRRWLDPSKPGTLRYITDLAKECAQMGFDEILLDWFLYPISGDQSALELPADKTVVLKDFAQALEKQLPEGTVLSVVLRETPSADNGVTAELLASCFDRVYVMPDADASALPTGYDRATRVVTMAGYAPESDSYLVTQ